MASDRRSANANGKENSGYPKLIDADDDCVSIEQRPRVKALGHSNHMDVQGSSQKLLSATKSQKSIKIKKSPGHTKSKSRLVKQGSEYAHDHKDHGVPMHSFVSFETSLKGLLIKKKDIYTGEESPNEDEGIRTPVHRGREDSSQEIDEGDIDIYSNGRNKLSNQAQNCKFSLLSQ